jgi:hypothetical protein
MAVAGLACAQSRRKSKNGDVLLNENDIKSLPGSTLEERVNNINGQILNENEALELINQEEWYDYR